MNVFIVCILIVGAFIGGQCVERHFCIPKSNEKLEVYADYFVCTEHLLDLLNKKYDWVDAIDHQGYYETRDEVVFLDYQGLYDAQQRFNKVLEWEDQQNK